MKVNLVLSGGAARGIAHIGVIKALEEMGFSIKALSGSSAGALVSVFYAYGYTPEEMLRIVKGTKWLTLFTPRIPRRGLFSLSRAENLLRKLIDKERIEDLERKVFVCVTDLLSARPLYLDRGELVPILLGSCALPGVFEPIRYGNHLLVDGGVMNNLPVEPFERYRTLKVGVDVNPMEKVTDVRSIVGILVRSFFLAVRSNVDRRKEMCDVLITPNVLGFSPLDVDKADELYRLGYEKTMEVMSRLIPSF